MKRRWIPATAACALLFTVNVAAASTPPSVKDQRALDGLLQTASSLKVLPTALHVPINRLEGTVNSWKPSCLVDYKSTTATGDRPSDQACTTGDVHSNRTVVLFGDSHATMWGLALSQLGVAEHFKLITVARAACYVASTPMWNNPANAPGTACTAFRNWAIAHINSLHPAAVIVSDHASSHNSDATDHTIPPPVYAAAEAATLRSLSAPHRIVIALGRTYDAPRPLASCLARSSSDIQRCAVSINNAHSQISPFEASSAAIGHATYISPIPWLCTNTTCPPVVDGYPVLADDNHLDAQYTVAILPVIDTALDRAGL
jgi:SGNH domain (fused to AT3 domains)